MSYLVVLPEVCYKINNQQTCNNMDTKTNTKQALYLRNLEYHETSLHIQDTIDVQAWINFHTISISYSEVTLDWFLDDVASQRRKIIIPCQLEEKSVECKKKHQSPASPSWICLHGTGVGLVTAMADSPLKPGIGQNHQLMHERMWSVNIR